jgi:hypothetical protein
MFLPAAGYYKVPLNSTLGFLRIGVARCLPFHAGAL